MTLRNQAELDYTSIIFANNEVQYRELPSNKVSYLQIEIAHAKILSSSDGIIWLELPDKFAEIINRIDVEFVSRVSTSISDYFRRVSTIKSSLVPSVRGKYVVCPVHIRSYTKYRDGAMLVAGAIIKAHLSVNYNKTGLIWSAVSMQSHNDDINDILQECLLETDAVEVIKI